MNIYYKAFNKDLTCRGFQYKEGATYEITEKPVICERGFHFCKELILTLQYYPVANITDNAYAEVEALGDIDWEVPNKHKGCTNKIKILRLLSDSEVNAMIDNNCNSGGRNSGDYNSGSQNSGGRNSGDYNSGSQNSGSWNSGSRNSGIQNTGDCNSGNQNSGSRNSGIQNTGDCNSGNQNSGNQNSGSRNSGSQNSGSCNSGSQNSGDRNSGNWNSCNNSSGFFNTITYITAFNKPCDITVWDKASKPLFLYFKPDKDLGYKGSLQKSFESATPEDIELLKALPNFDADVFFNISGIRV